MGSSSRQPEERRQSPRDLVLPQQILPSAPGRSRSAEPSSPLRLAGEVCRCSPSRASRDRRPGGGGAFGAASRRRRAHLWGTSEIDTDVRRSLILMGWDILLGTAVGEGELGRGEEGGWAASDGCEGGRSCCCRGGPTFRMATCAPTDFRRSRQAPISEFPSGMTRPAIVRNAGRRSVMDIVRRGANCSMRGSSTAGGVRQDAGELGERRARERAAVEKARRAGERRGGVGREEGSARVVSGRKRRGLVSRRSKGSAGSTWARQTPGR